MTNVLPSIVRPQDIDEPVLGHRKLRRKVREGTLHQLVRGQYVDRKLLEGLTTYEQFVLLLASLMLRPLGSAVLVGESAAYLWGLPLPKTPPKVMLQRVRQGQKNGPNFVRRTVRLSTFSTIAYANFRVLDKTCAAVEVAQGLPLQWAVALFDRLLSGRALLLESGARPFAAYRLVTKDELRETILLCKTKRARSRLLEALDLADGRAESPGESRTRVLIKQLGFEDVDLQVALSDADGFVGRVDMLMPVSRIVIEFDGKIKYTDPSMLGNKTSGDAVFGEKVREDRIRALGYSVVRVYWSDLKDPNRLERKLRQAGAKAR